MNHSYSSNENQTVTDWYMYFTMAKSAFKTLVQIDCYSQQQVNPTAFIFFEIGNIVPLIYQ